MLTQLCPGNSFSKDHIKNFHGRLAIMIGRWSAEQGRLDISPLVKTFTAMREDLERIAKVLSGRDEGIRESHDKEFVSQLTSVLALNPEVGSRRQAKKLIESFRRDAATLGHACLVTGNELKKIVGRRGRPRRDWYDDFTALLLDIADAAEVKPTLYRDRVSGERVGWLMDAAAALETFLNPPMRSLSKEARSTRLERSARTLRHRQKYPRR